MTSHSSRALVSPNASVRYRQDGESHRILRNVPLAAPVSPRCWMPAVNQWDRQPNPCEMHPPIPIMRQGWAMELRKYGADGDRRSCGTTCRPKMGIWECRRNSSGAQGIGWGNATYIVCEAPLGLPAVRFEVVDTDLRRPKSKLAAY